MYTCNLLALADERRDQMKPPVCNTMVSNTGALRSMLIGGPNNRQEYHYNRTEEVFLQLKGDMILKVIERGTPREITIREGELFVLPAAVPHSPQRFANTLGFVMERGRHAGETDGIRFFTDSTCTRVLWQRFAMVNDLSKDLVPITSIFHSSQAAATGIPEVDMPAADFEGDVKVNCPVPRKLDVLVSEAENVNTIQSTARNTSFAPELIQSTSFRVSLLSAKTASLVTSTTDIFIMLMRGGIRVNCGDATVELTHAYDVVDSCTGVDSVDALTCDTVALIFEPAVAASTTHCR